MKDQSPWKLQEARQGINPVVCIHDGKKVNVHERLLEELKKKWHAYCARCKNHKPCVTGSAIAKAEGL
jgi:hypothetical protein